jgi:hypothetical protein
LSGVRVKSSIARVPKNSLRRSVSSCTFPFCLDFCTSIYLFYLVLILNFDACIVTITWAHLGIVIFFLVIRLPFVVLFSLGLVKDWIIKVGVSHYKL